MAEFATPEYLSFLWPLDPECYGKLLGYFQAAMDGPTGGMMVDSLNSHVAHAGTMGYNETMLRLPSQGIVTSSRWAGRWGRAKLFALKIG